jgi:leader peptidase (prepilin peptidase)/N-methyltransferase
LLLGFLIGGLIGIILLFTRKKTGKDVIAFGPYLAMGGLLALLRGFDIINWYLALFT